MKLKTSNKAKIDSNGYVIATIESIEHVDASSSDYEREQYNFTFKVKGTKKAIYMQLWTGATISTQKYYIKSESDYSALSKLVMNLGLISNEELTAAEDAGEDVNINLLDELIGKSVRFKLIKPSKRAKFERPDLETIELINN